MPRSSRKPQSGLYTRHGKSILGAVWGRKHRLGFVRLVRNGLRGRANGSPVLGWRWPDRVFRDQCGALAGRGHPLSDRRGDHETEAHGTGHDLGLRGRHCRRAHPRDARRGRARAVHLCGAGTRARGDAARSNRVRRRKARSHTHRASRRPASTASATSRASSPTRRRPAASGKRPVGGPQLRRFPDLSILEWDVVFTEFVGGAAPVPGWGRRVAGVDSAVVAAAAE